MFGAYYYFLRTLWHQITGIQAYGTKHLYILIVHRDLKIIKIIIIIVIIIIHIILYAYTNWYTHIKHNTLVLYARKKLNT